MVTERNFLSCKHIGQRNSWDPLRGGLRVRPTLNSKLNQRRKTDLRDHSAYLLGRTPAPQTRDPHRVHLLRSPRLTSNVRIRKHFPGNLYSSLEYDCVIGDFAAFAAGLLRRNGNVAIGDGSYIGAGTMLRQGTPDKPLRIGAGAIVGIGAVVTKDVEDGPTVAGYPAHHLSQATKKK